jgi:hypothetical protein
MPIEKRHLPLEPSWQGDIADIHARHQLGRCHRQAAPSGDLVSAFRLAKERDPPVPRRPARQRRRRAVGAVVGDELEIPETLPEVAMT